MADKDSSGLPGGLSGTATVSTALSTITRNRSRPLRASLAVATVSISVRGTTTSCARSTSHNRGKQRLPTKQSSVQGPGRSMAQQSMRVVIANRVCASEDTSNITFLGTLQPMICPRSKR